MSYTIYYLLTLQKNRTYFFGNQLMLKLIDGLDQMEFHHLIKKLSIKASKFQSGFIYQYAFVMLIGFSALLTFLILNNEFSNSYHR